MKKAVYILILCALLLCACHFQPGREASVESSPAIPQWKAAYLAYLEESRGTYVSFSLVHIDDDEIPELYLSGNCPAVGDAVCSWKKGQLVDVHLIRIGGGRYAQGSGVLINHNGSTGQIYTHVYQLTEDGFIQTFSALSAERLSSDSYETTYEYSVEGAPVSEEAYQAAIAAAFPFFQSERLNAHEASYDLIRQQITDWE